MELEYTYPTHHISLYISEDAASIIIEGCIQSQRRGHLPMRTEACILASFAESMIAGVRRGEEDEVSDCANDNLLLMR